MGYLCWHTGAFPLLCALSKLPMPVTWCFTWVPVAPRLHLFADQGRFTAAIGQKQWLVPRKSQTAEQLFHLCSRLKQRLQHSADPHVPRPAVGCQTRPSPPETHSRGSPPDAGFTAPHATAGEPGTPTAPVDHITASCRHIGSHAPLAIRVTAGLDQINKLVARCSLLCESSHTTRAAASWTDCGHACTGQPGSW